MIGRKNIHSRIKALTSNGFSYAFMKIIARFYFFRKISQYFNKKISPTTLDNSDDEKVLLKEGLTIGEVVEQLNQYGISECFHLTEDFNDFVMEYCQKNLCYANGNPKFGFPFEEVKRAGDAIEQTIETARYFNLKSNSPDFRRFSNSRLLASIASSYLNTDAKQVATQLWWSFPSGGDEEAKSFAAQYFHRDVDDYGFLKFFFYINTTDHRNGPHFYVSNSHKPSFRQSIREHFRITRFRDDQIEKWYSSENILQINGGKGEGFAEDTFGFHKGEPPSAGLRLLLCSVYALNDFKVQDFIQDVGSLKAISYS